MSASKKAYYPAISRQKDPVKAIPAISESIEILTGARGNGLDKAVTRRELLASGAFKFSPGVGGGSAGGGNLIPNFPDLNGPVEYPTQPENVQATGGFTFIMVEWDAPTFRGFAYAEVWRSPDDDFGTAVRVATTEASIYIDPVELESGYYYWVRFANINGAVGPLHGTAGVYAETARDIDKIREVLTGVITSTELASALKTRIDLVDAGAEIAGSVNARVTAEAAARAGQVSTLTAAIIAEQTARGVDVSALNAAIIAEAAARGVDVSGLNAAIIAESSARISEDESIVEQIDLIIATTESSAAAILAEQTARASADTALASSITTLTASVASNTSAITTEQTARADGDSALAASITALGVTVSGNSAAITAEQTARASADTAISTSITALTTSVADNAAAITAEATARSSADSALSSSLTTLSASVSGNAAAILSEQTARASADTALSNSITLIGADVDSNAAAILAEQTARASADSALSSSITALTTTVNANTAAISTEQTTRSDADSALASSISALASTVSSNSAAISSESTTRATADSALASSISSLTTTVNGNTSSISTIQTTTNGLAANYMVKLDVNGYVSGFGLWNSGPGSSGFLIHAANFAVGIPDIGGSAVIKYPFMIGVVDGVTSIVLNATTFIPDASITGGRIADVTIENSKIVDATIGGSKIALSTITNSNIVDGTITGAKIAGGTITGTNIFGGTINDTHIAGGSIKNAQIDTGAVGSLKIAGNAVTVPAGASVTSNQLVTTSFATITDIYGGGTVTVDWGTTAPPEMVQVIVFANFSPQATGSDQRSIAIRVNASVGGSGGDVGKTTLKGYSDVLATVWGYTGHSGSVTYSLQARCAESSTDYRIAGMGILIIGVRR